MQLVAQGNWDTVSVNKCENEHEWGNDREVHLRLLSLCTADSWCSKDVFDVEKAK